MDAKHQQTVVACAKEVSATGKSQKVTTKEKIMVTLPRQESKGRLRGSKAATGKETRSDWVDCEKIPETKKSIRKYDNGGGSGGCERAQAKQSSTSEARGDSSIQTLSVTQIGKEYMQNCMYCTFNMYLYKYLVPGHFSARQYFVPWTFCLLDNFPPDISHLEDMPLGHSTTQKYNSKLDGIFDNLNPYVVSSYNCMNDFLCGILTLIRMACFGPKSYMTLHLQSPIA